MTQLQPPPPEPDDPRYARTCNLCSTVRPWTMPYCPKCGCDEFRLPPGGTVDEEPECENNDG